MGTAVVNTTIVVLHRTIAEKDVNLSTVIVLMTTGILGNSRRRCPLQLAHRLRLPHLLRTKCLPTHVVGSPPVDSLVLVPTGEIAAVNIPTGT